MEAVRTTAKEEFDKKLQSLVNATLPTANSSELVKKLAEHFSDNQKLDERLSTVKHLLDIAEKLHNKIVEAHKQHINRRG